MTPCFISPYIDMLFFSLLIIASLTFCSQQQKTITLKAAKKELTSYKLKKLLSPSSSLNYLPKTESSFDRDILKAGKDYIAISDDVIGTGKYGVVYKAQNLHSGEDLVVKVSKDAPTKPVGKKKLLALKEAFSSHEQAYLEFLKSNGKAIEKFEQDRKESFKKGEFLPSRDLIKTKERLHQLYVDSLNALERALLPGNLKTEVKNLKATGLIYGDGSVGRTSDSQLAIPMKYIKGELLHDKLYKLAKSGNEAAFIEAAKRGEDTLTAFHRKTNFLHGDVDYHLKNVLIGNVPSKGGKSGSGIMDRSRASVEGRKSFSKDGPIDGGMIDLGRASPLPKQLDSRKMETLKEISQYRAAVAGYAGLYGRESLQGLLETASRSPNKPLSSFFEVSNK